MTSEGSAIGRFFHAIGRGIAWVFKDDERILRTGSGEPAKNAPGGAEEEEEKEVLDYDPWDEIRNMRMNFWFGSWITRKFRPIGEDKLRAQLKAIEEKREAEEKKEGE